MVMLMDTECILRLHREQGINRAQSGTRIQRWWGTFATCSAENEKRSPEGGGGGMKVQEDLYRVISYRRTNLHGDTGGAYFIIVKGCLIHMGHCEILSHLRLSPAGDKGRLSWRLCEDIAAG